MSAILKFIRPFELFDSQTLAVLGTAYDKAILNLHDRGQPNIVHEVIAMRVFDLAAKGERDIDRLCADAIGRDCE
jgi:hypothetical protein